MEKKRVLLVSQPNLLGESLEHILSKLEDVQFAGACAPDEQLLAHCAEQPLDLVVIAEDEPCDQQVGAAMSMLLEAYPNLPLIRVKLDCNTLFIYTSQAVPARVADLIEAIRQVPVAVGRTDSPSYELGS